MGTALGTPAFSEDDQDFFSMFYADAAMQKDHGVVKDLVDMGFNPNMENHFGYPPIVIAARGNDLLTAQMLLGSQLADPNMPTKAGRTALMVAAEKGHSAMVRLLLLTRGIDPFATDKYKRSALMFAARFGHEMCVKLLVWAGRQGPPAFLREMLAAKDEDGKTALQHAQVAVRDAVDPAGAGRLRTGRAACASLLIATGAAGLS